MKLIRLGLIMVLLRRTWSRSRVNVTSFGSDFFRGKFKVRCVSYLLLTFVRFFLFFWHSSCVFFSVWNGQLVFIIHVISRFFKESSSDEGSACSTPNWISVPSLFIWSTSWIFFKLSKASKNMQSYAMVIVSSGRFGQNHEEKAACRRQYSIHLIYHWNDNQAG